MSKSLGNSLLVKEVVHRVRPIELRYYLVSAHYRSMIEYSDEALAEAGQGFRRQQRRRERWRATRLQFDRLQQCPPGPGDRRAACRP